MCLMLYFFIFTYFFVNLLISDSNSNFFRYIVNNMKMMLKNLIFCLILASTSFVPNVSSTNLPPLSTPALKKLFDSVKPYSDLNNAFYSAKGLELLGETLSAASQAVSIYLYINFFLL